MRTQLTRLSARLSLFLAACRAGRHRAGAGPGGACRAALGVLSWRNPRIMNDWLDRPNYCPPIAGYDGDVAVSVAARVDEAAPEAADDWMPCSASAGSVAVVVREPLARFLAGVATATTTGTAHAAAWSAWREKRGHEAAEDEAKLATQRPPTRAMSQRASATRQHSLSQRAQSGKRGPGLYTW